MKKYRKRIIIILTAIFLVLFVSVTALNYTSGRRVRIMLQEIRDAGEPLTLAEMAPPNVPDDENAAIPLVIAGKLLKQNAAEKEFHSRNPKKSLDEYCKGLLDESTREQAVDALRKIIDKNQEALNYLDEATALDKCRFDMDYDIEDVNGVIIPNVHARISGRILVARAMLLAATGQPDQAFESIRQIFVITSFFKDACFTLNVNTAADLNGIGTDGLKKAVSFSAPSVQNCHNLIDALRAGKQAVNMYRALCGDRLFSFSVMKWIKGDHSNLSVPPDSGDVVMLIYSLPKPLFPKFLINYSYIYCLELTARTIKSIDLPYKEAIKEFRAVESQIQEIPKALVLAGLMAPSLKSALIIETQNDAHLGAAEVALQLIIYKEENGVFPETLVGLDEDIPLDPFTDKSFLYRRGGDGFVVYSVGENLLDDGGIVESNDKKKRQDIGFAYRYTVN
jgi:tetratricopeptide (TPR) repeat protein